MDNTDIRLAMMLLVNSRTSYRDMADRLGLSVNAVHKRIQAMIEEGIIRAFTARISLSALDAITVIIYGRADSVPAQELRQRLHSSPNVYWLAITGGDDILVGAFLRSLNELEAHINFVRSACHMSTHFLGIMSAPSLDESKDRQLYPLDYRIINALHNDARKTIGQVAEELEISAKTVKRRLDRLETSGLVEFSLEWYPDASNDIITLFQMELAEGVDKVSSGFGLMKKYEPNFLLFMPFQNDPGTMFAITWSPTTKQMRELREQLAQESFVRRCVPNIIYTGIIFDTWRDDLLIEKARQFSRRSSEQE